MSDCYLWLCIRQLICGDCIHGRGYSHLVCMWGWVEPESKFVFWDGEIPDQSPWFGS